MEKLIRSMVAAIVDLPEDIIIKRIGNNKNTIYEIRVAKTDIGKLIGKQGRNIEALRTIISATGKKCNKRSLVQVIE